MTLTPPYPKANQLFIFFALLTANLCFAEKIATDASPIRIIDESWINGSSSASWGARPYSLLHARYVGLESVWATYLAIIIPGSWEYKSPQKLILHLAPRDFEDEAKGYNSNGTYRLHLVESANWTRRTLAATNAPGWDTFKFDVSPQAILVDEVILHSHMEAKLEFSLKTADPYFQRLQGKQATLVITKQGGRSTTFFSTSSNGEFGPKIE